MNIYKYRKVMAVAAMLGTFTTVFNAVRAYEPDTEVPIETIDICETEESEISEDAEVFYITEETGFPEETEFSEETELIEETEFVDETEASIEYEEIDQIIFDHYYSGIDENNVNTAELFVMTPDPSVFTCGTEVVSNYDNVYVIAFDSVEQARFAYSYYVDKVDFITDMSDAVTVCTDDQSPDTEDPNDINNGTDAISNLNDIDTSAVNLNGYIALIDTGVNGGGFRYSVVGDNPSDNSGHGSLMAGYILEENPCARIVSIKVSEDGNASAADVYAGFRLAVDLHVSVISFSMTGLNTEKNAVLKQIIREALDAGIVVIGAAGNNGVSSTLFIPGCIDDVITVGAACSSGVRCSNSNYDADFYVVSGSTSEAAARCAGMYSAGNIADNILRNRVFDEIGEDDYWYAYEAADLMTQTAQSEGNNICYSVVINEDGTPSYVSEYLSDGFTVASNAAEISWASTEYAGSVPAGVYTGTCTTASAGTFRGYASAFTGDNAFSRVANALGNIPIVCSKAADGAYYGESWASDMPKGNCNYRAEVDAQGNITLYVTNGRDASINCGMNLSSAERTASYTYSESVSASGSGSSMVYTLTRIDVYGTNPITGADDGWVWTGSETYTSASALRAAINSKLAGRYSGKINLNLGGIGTFTIEHFGSQRYVGRLYTTPQTTTGYVEFSKVGSDQNPLSGAIIYFVCTGGEGLGHEGELTVSGAEGVSGCTYNGYTGRQFTTIGSTVRIDGLRPNSTYVFHEYQSPLLPDGSGRRYALASDRTVSVASDGTCSPGMITMVDGDNPYNADFSSISIMKIWEPSSGAYYDEDGSFWSDASFVSFAMGYRSSWDDVQQYGWSYTTFCYGHLYQVGAGNPFVHRIDPVTGLAYFSVGWDCSREAAASYGGVNLYSGSNEGIPGRYFQHEEGGRFVDNEGTWTTDVTYLPYGYYRVTEYWEEAYMSLEGRKVFIESANESGWYLEEGGPGTGSCLYSIIIKIDGNGTHLCDHNGNIVSDLPLEGGVRVARAQNASLTARVDVTKIDETGSIDAGEAVVSFELRDSSNSRPLIATGTLDSNSGSVNGDGYYQYAVNWNYSYYQTYRTNDSLWHSAYKVMSNEAFVGHLNFGDYYIYEYIRDRNGNNIAGDYRIPEGWQAWDNDTGSEWYEGDPGEPEYFYRLVTVTRANHTDPLMVQITNREYAITINVDKYDEWSGQILSGYSGDYDLAYSLYCDVNGNGMIDDNDTFIDTLSDTDRDGHIRFHYRLSDLYPGLTNGEWPEHYLVTEETAPFDYYLNPVPFEVDFANGYGRYNIDAYDTPYHTHIRIFKLDGDTSEAVNGAVFTVYNDTDGNGVYSEGVDTVATAFVNGQAVEAQAVWNQAEGCYVTSELRSGRYIVVETGLPYGYLYTDENGVPTFARNEDLVIVEPMDTSVPGFEPVVYDVTFYNLVPQISTTLTDPLTQSHVAHIGDDVMLVDTVSYRNLVPGTEYTITGTIMVKQTGMPLADGNGNIAVSTISFVPDSPDGTVEVTIDVDTEYIMSLVADGQLDAPVDLVCYEVLEFSVRPVVPQYPQWYDTNPTATHEDINDEGQTVRAGEIKTGVYDTQSLSQVASMGPDGDGYAVIIDNVHYEGLQPGRTYTMYGEMHMLAYDVNGNTIDGGVVNGADSREVLHPSATFTPESHDGYIEVIYVINVNRFRGETMVSFETCKQDGVTVMWHCDIEDFPQTLFIPDVHTNAYCADTTPGEMGRTVIGLDQRARIVDEVSYENLLTDRPYMIQGCLYWMYTDEGGSVHSGPMSDIIGEAQAVATVIVTPDAQDGTVEMVFTFDSTVLADLHYDRLVVCETVFANGGIGWKPVAHHWDFSYENNSQSIMVPDVHTVASTVYGSILPSTGMVTVTDRVYYENLVPGVSYTVEGSIQYAVTDAQGNLTSCGPLVQNGGEVRASTTFIPSQSTGFVDVVFSVDAEDISARGYDKLVVFEELYVSPGIRAAVHADIKDEGQTINICSLSSSATGPDGGRSVAPAAEITITDTVYYSGLVPGREYRMETDLMNFETGESDLHCSTVFCPEISEGCVDIALVFDGSEYSVEKLVVFESVYDNQTGILIQSHCDWNEKSQTITFMPGTGLAHDGIYREYGVITLFTGAGTAALWYIVPRKRRKVM